MQGIFLFAQRQMQSAPKSQYNDKQRLDAMHDKGEEGGVRITYPLEHHHGDDGKMPRAGTIWGGHNDGERSGYKHHKSCLEA